MFVTQKDILTGTWQSFERIISRLLIAEGFLNVRVVGSTGDHGADVIGTKYGKRWLLQAKHWNKPVGCDVLEQTIAALVDYHAQIPVVVSARDFEKDVAEYQKSLISQGIPIQLWTADTIGERASKLPNAVINKRSPREYQETAIKNILEPYLNKHQHRSLIVLATGLGKTFVAAEAMRRINNLNQARTLVLAHTNPLVYQLERSFWPFLLPSQKTTIWNGYEKPSDDFLSECDFVFACVDSVADRLRTGNLPDFDVIIVDECHHAGSETYQKILGYYNVGQHGPFVLGLTATPWRPDHANIYDVFGEPRIQIDMVEGMKKGFLSNVDYRMHTDNINWDSLKTIEGKRFSPKQINRTLFINQWDDAVVVELQKAWSEQTNPRAIVFCGTIEHAITMKNKINALGFCNAAALYAQGQRASEQLTVYERNRLLSDFADGIINVVCTVDIFNEGIDVPDVNIIVFQRVTHSRRIFIQQLGRGLRISEGKEKVIVLDFVSDIRRFAAGLELKDSLKETVRIDLPSKVTFKQVGGEDPKAESFLRAWLEDITIIEQADDDASVLKFPPKFS